MAVETLITMKQGVLNSVLQEMDQAFVGFRKLSSRKSISKLSGDNKTDSVLGIGEFKEEVGKALDNGGVHHFPEVVKTAEMFRDQLFGPLIQRAICTWF